MGMTLANALCAVSKFQIERAGVDGNDERAWGGAQVPLDRIAFQRAVPIVPARSARGRITSVSKPPVLLAMLRAEPVEVLGQYPFHLLSGKTAGLDAVPGVSQHLVQVR